MTDILSVDGKSISLTHNRSVFLGAHPQDVGCSVVRFENDGQVLAFALSDEAIAALILLVTTRAEDLSDATVDYQRGIEVHFPLALTGA